MKTVLVIGGGVAGLTAAHELAVRGFSVTVCEARGATSGDDRETSRALGGKARSQFFTHEGRELPGEHGFRFFPGYYAHIPDTFARIPSDGESCETRDPRAVPSRSVLDELSASEAFAVARNGARCTLVSRRPTPGPRDIAALLGSYLEAAELPAMDYLKLWRKLSGYYYSCDRRRLDQYERLSFWEFIEGDSLSPAGRTLVRNMPKALVAMDSVQGNARTMCNTLFLLMSDQFAGREQDRVLSGPTTTRWIEPWYRWLRRLGVAFRTGEAGRAEKLRVGRKRVREVRFADGSSLAADHVVLAVPLEAALPLLDPEVCAASPMLARLKSIEPRLEQWLGWMNGVQLYLSRKPRLVRGHVAHVDAPWGVTFLSQERFWRGFAELVPSPIATVLSADVTKWQGAPGYNGKDARDCNERELVEELVRQIGTALDDDGVPIVRPEDVLVAHVDDDLVRNASGALENRARLLIHPPGSWDYRPEAETELSNLYVASDYVRTHTDLATMEGANEAARRAVNAVLVRENRVDPCLIVDQLAAAEPDWLTAAKLADEMLYDRGQPVSLPPEIGEDEPYGEPDGSLFGGLLGEVAERLLGSLAQRERRHRTAG